MKSWKKLLKQRMHDYVVSRYEVAGLTWGDAASYLYVGRPIGFDNMIHSLVYWEKKYTALGYCAITPDMWVKAGGYGASIKLCERETNA